MRIKLRIKEQRQRLGLTQQELAEKLNMRQATISDLEKEKIVPTLETTIEIANIFNMSLDELVEFDKAHKEHSDELAKQFYKDKK